MASVGVERARTLRALKLAREARGDLSRATWAAYGRAIAVWGEGSLKAVAPKMPQLSPTFPLSFRDSLVSAMNVASVRAARCAGYRNRATRRHTS